MKKEVYFMKKIKKIRNGILISIILFFFINFLLYVLLILIKKTPLFEYPIFYRENFSSIKYFNDLEFSVPSGNAYRGKSIILFGCGYVSKRDDKPDKTFDYYLAKNLNKKVYNRAIGGAGFQQAILQVENHLLDDIIKNSSHAIFFLPGRNDTIRLRVYPGPLIDNHFVLSKSLYPRYEINKEKKLQIHKSYFPIIEGSIIYRLIEKIWNTFVLTSNFQKINHYDKNLELIKLHILKLNYELKLINPDIKLTVLLYFDSTNTFDKISNELSENDIEIISAREIENFDVDKFPDPTEELWSSLTPFLIEKLNIN